MADLSMAEIANAIHVHILNGTMNVDSINASLHPTASMILFIYTENPTPATNPPQNTAAIDEQGRKTVYSRGRIPDLATRVMAASQMPGIYPASQLNDAQEGSGSSGLRTRGQETQHSRSSWDGTRSALDIKGKQTAYPAPLASQNPRKRKLSLRRIAPKKAPKLTIAGTDIQQGPGMEVKAGGESADEDNQRNRDPAKEVAKKALLQKWIRKMPRLSSWEGLENHAFVGNQSYQEPYGVLNDILERIYGFGTLKVQKAFVQSVHSWIESGQKKRVHLQHPDRLGNVDGYDDAIPFQRIWRAERIPHVIWGSGVMAALLNRKALIDKMKAYDEIVLEVRKKAKEGKLRLDQGENASTKARDIIYHTLHVNNSDRESLLSVIDSAQKSGKLFVELVRHYGSIGILAMIPATLAETKLRAGDRVAIAIELLDIIRPDLRNQKLELYSKVIDTIGDGNDPDKETLAELDSWIEVLISQSDRS